MTAFWLALFLQDSPEAEFRKFEKGVAEEKAIAVTFRGERVLRGTERSTWSGTMRIQGSKFVVTVAHNLHGEDRVETLRSDGKRTVLLVRDQARERNTSADLPRLHRAALTRAGFLLENRPLRDALDGRRVTEEVFPVAPKRVTREQGHGADYSVVDYALSYGSEEWAIRLWIDARSLAPVRRRATRGAEEEWSETYSAYSTAAIPEKEFEIE